jgi:hypothetical protein
MSSRYSFLFEYRQIFIDIEILISWFDTIGKIIINFQYL